MTVTEQELWYLLDDLAVTESGNPQGDRKKVDAITTLMRHLEKPSPEACRVLHEQGYRVVA